MSTDRGSVDLRSIARFQITRGQWLLAALAIFSIISLGVSTLAQSNSTINQSAMLSNVETPAASVIFTQRETLVYATRLAQWSNGGTTRRTVQIARNLLAQRLAVIDISGRSMGSRANDSYWEALRASDAVVAKAQPGVLPESIHMQVSAEISPIIDKILSEARKLVVSYQRSIDKENKLAVEEIAHKNLISLIFFYLSLLFSGLFLLLNVLTNFKNYRMAGKAIDEEQRRLDETFRELEIAQSTVTELKRLNDAKNAFIATVNHELRTPLTSIIGYIDIMRESATDKDNPANQQYLDTLDRNAQILLNLVESMLTLTKIEGDQIPLSMEKVWLNEVIDNAIFTMKPQAIKSAISIHLESDDEYFVEGDAGLLTQVFINLLGNAVKFSPSGSAINITVGSFRNEKGVGFAKISIADKGIGIPAEDIDQLFTRFFRAKNVVSEHFQGTGLGLSIVAQVLQRHNAQIEVHSVEGEGTTFTLDIPLFLTSDEKFIRNRRGDVLKRAITALESSTPETIRGIAHEMGGALGFYGFTTAGSDLVEYSRTLVEGIPPSYGDFEIVKRTFLEALKIEDRKNGGISHG